MKTMTATEVARNFSEVLTAVERDHETIEVTRGGKQIATINPTSTGNAAAVLRLLRDHPVDDDFYDDIRDGLRFVVDKEPEWLD